jgi:hypothetical protein
MLGNKHQRVHSRKKLMPRAGHHICNSSFSGGEGKRITVQGQPRQNLGILSQKPLKAKRPGVGVQADGSSGRMLA